MNGDNSSHTPASPETWASRMSNVLLAEDGDRVVFDEEGGRIPGKEHNGKGDRRWKRL